MTPPSVIAAISRAIPHGGDPHLARIEVTQATYDAIVVETYGPDPEDHPPWTDQPGRHLWTTPLAIADDILPNQIRLTVNIQ